MRLLAIGFAIAAATVSAIGASAQQLAAAYPTTRVSIVVPVSPGSVTDVLSRVLADSLQPLWNQPIIVENRPSIPGTLSVARGPADGYTLLMTSNGHTVLSEINKSLPFDPLKDFSGVAQIASVPFVLVATPSLPVSNVKELIQLARAKPGTLNIALPGLGTAASIAGELFLREAGIDIARIPYKGGPDAHIAVLSGDAHLVFSAVNIGLPMIKSGQLRALAVTTSHRLAAIPDVPTLAEAGLPNFSYDAWFGVMVRSKTDKVVAEKLSHDILAVAGTPEFRQRLEAQGLEPIMRNSDEFNSTIRKDTERFAGLFQRLGEAAK